MSDATASWILNYPNKPPSNRKRATIYLFTFPLPSVGIFNISEETKARPRQECHSNSNMSSTLPLLFMGLVRTVVYTIVNFKWMQAIIKRSFHTDFHKSGMGSIPHPDGKVSETIRPNFVVTRDAFLGNSGS